MAIEQASTFGWDRYVGADGAVVGMDTFGASARLKALQTKFGSHPIASSSLPRSGWLPSGAERGGRLSTGI